MSIHFSFPPFKETEENCFLLGYSVHLYFNFNEYGGGGGRHVNKFPWKTPQKKISSAACPNKKKGKRLHLTMGGSQNILSHFSHLSQPGDMPSWLVQQQQWHQGEAPGWSFFPDWECFAVGKKVLARWPPKGQMQEKRKWEESAVEKENGGRGGSRSRVLLFLIRWSERAGHEDFHVG